MGGHRTHAWKSRRAANMRSATLFLDLLPSAEAAPRPLIPTLMERFDLRRRDAWVVASEWDNRINGRPQEQYLP